MTRPTFLSLFSGIGGLDLGLERAGWECVGQVENDPYCQRVLAKHWPDVPRWGDIKELDPDDLPRADLIAGGFPCQPVSTAGKRLGRGDPRWLWPEVARVVRHLRPRWVLLENVPGLLARGMDEVVGDLAEIWNGAEWDCLSALAVGAPHERERLFVVAYPERDQLRQQPGWLYGSRREATAVPGDNGQAWAVADPQRPGWDGLHEWQQAGRLAADPGDGGTDVTDGPAAEYHRRRVPRARQESSHLARLAEWWATEPEVGRVVHGVSRRVVRRQLKALGNAVVPQVAELIGRRILEADAA